MILVCVVYQDDSFITSWTGVKMVWMDDSVVLSSTGAVLV